MQLKRLRLISNCKSPWCLHYQNSCINTYWALIKPLRHRFKKNSETFDIVQTFADTVSPHKV